MGLDAFLYQISKEKYEEELALREEHEGKEYLSNKDLSLIQFLGDDDDEDTESNDEVIDEALSFIDYFEELEPMEGIEESVCYLRKHHDVQDYFEEKYYDLVNDTDIEPNSPFNCQYISVSEGDCLGLIEQSENMTTTSEIDEYKRKKNIEVFKSAKEALNKGYKVYYSCWR